jgi:hypothetical protein
MHHFDQLKYYYFNLILRNPLFNVFFLKKKNSGVALVKKKKKKNTRVAGHPLGHGVVRPPLDFFIYLFIYFKKTGGGLVTLLGHSHPQTGRFGGGRTTLMA